MSWSGINLYTFDYDKYDYKYKITLEGNRELYLIKDNEYQLYLWDLDIYNNKRFYKRWFETMPDIKKYGTSITMLLNMDEFLENKLENEYFTAEPVIEHFSSRLYLEANSDMFFYSIQYNPRCRYSDISTSQYTRIPIRERIYQRNKRVKVKTCDISQK